MDDARRHRSSIFPFGGCGPSLRLAESLYKEFRLHAHHALKICNIKGDDLLSLEELSLVFLVLKIEDYSPRHIFQLFDRNESEGHISAEEVLPVLEAILQSSCPASVSDLISLNIGKATRMKRIYRIVDFDNSGNISCQELRGRLIELGKGIKDDEVERVISLLNVDGNEIISWGEFLSATIKEGVLEKEHEYLIDNLGNLPSFMLPSDSSISARSPSYVSLVLALYLSLYCIFILFASHHSLPLVITNYKEEAQNHIINRLGSLERMGVKFLRYVHQSLTLKNRKKKVKSKITPQERYRSLRQLSWLAFSLTLLILTFFRPGSSRYHKLTESDRTHLVIIASFGVLLAMGAGAAGPLLGYVAAYLIEMVDNAYIGQSITIGLSILASIVELVTMYGTALHITMQVCLVTRLELWPADKDRVFILASLARAALQVGNSTEKAYNVNPLRAYPAWKQMIILVWYKLKRGLLTFVVKLVVKRLIWRAAAKELLDLFAIPVNSTMNALVMVAINRQIQIIATGPALTMEWLQGLMSSGTMLPATRLQMIRAVGVVVVHNKEFHPNLAVLLDSLWRYYNVTKGLDDPSMKDAQGIDDIQEFKKLLVQAKDPESCRPVLTVMIIAMILQGRPLSFTDRQLLFLATQSAGLPMNWEYFKALTVRFQSGRHISLEQISLVLTTKETEKISLGEKLQGIIIQSLDRLAC